MKLISCTNSSTVIEDYWIFIRNNFLFFIFVSSNALWWILLIHVFLFDYRDEDKVVKLPILAHHNSPLCYIDLQVSGKAILFVDIKKQFFCCFLWCKNCMYSWFLFSHKYGINLYGYICELFIFFSFSEGLHVLFAIYVFWYL